MTETLIKDFLWLIFLICGWILHSIASSYFKKKGENQATKEDITELTSLVKKVEQKFSHETEILKAQLSLGNQLKINFLNEERTVAINFQKGLRNFYSQLSSSAFAGIDMSQNIELDKFKYKVDEMYEDIINQQMLLLIYLEEENKVIEDLIYSIMIKILQDTKPLFNKYYFDLKNNNLAIENNTNMAEKLYNDRTAFSTTFFEDIRVKGSEITPLLADLRVSLKSYFNKKYQV